MEGQQPAPAQNPAPMTRPADMTGHGAGPAAGKLEPLIIVAVTNIAAVILGAVIGYPTSPVSWINSYLYLAFFASVFCLLPFAVAALLVHFIARKRGVLTSKYGLYLPALLYAPVLGYGSYLMSFAFYMADHQQSGSEYIPFILFYIGVTGFWVVPLITLVVNLILIFSQKKPVPPQTPAGVSPPSHPKI